MGNIGSFRSLCKRYCFHRALATPENETGAIYYNAFRMQNMPNGPGPAYGSSIASVLTRISGPADYNLCMLTYARYVISAYIGWRGAMRWKWSMFNEDLDIMSMKAVRDEEYRTTENRDATAVFAGSTSIHQFSQNMIEQFANYGSTAGSVAIAPNVNPTLEFELPFYSNYRYAECQEPPEGIVDYQVPFQGQSHHVEYTTRHEASNNYSWIEGYHSVGEDFSTFFFIGAPPLVTSDVVDVTPN